MERWNPRTGRQNPIFLYYSHLIQVNAEQAYSNNNNGEVPYFCPKSKLNSSDQILRQCMAKSKTNLTLEIWDERDTTFTFCPMNGVSAAAVAPARHLASSLPSPSPPPLPGLQHLWQLQRCRHCIFNLIFLSIHTEVHEPLSLNVSHRPITDIIHYRIGAEAGKVISHSKSHKACMHIETLKIFKSQIEMIQIELALVS